MISGFGFVFKRCKQLKCSFSAGLETESPISNLNRNQTKEKVLPSRFITAAKIFSSAANKLITKFL